MIHKCWQCKGSGRIRIDPMDPLVSVCSLGIIPLMRFLVESDRSDSSFWKDCKICEGNGYIKD